MFSGNEAVFIFNIFTFIKPLLFIHTFPTCSHSLLISAYCRVLGFPFGKKKIIMWCFTWILDKFWGGLHIFLFNHPLSLPQVLQRLRLSNRDEDAALQELLRLRRAQCEGRGNWKHCPPQSPPLPPTLLWTNRKASPWWVACAIRDGSRTLKKSKCSQRPGARLALPAWSMKPCPWAEGLHPPPWLWRISQRIERNSVTRVKISQWKRSGQNTCSKRATLFFGYQRCYFTTDGQWK